MIGRIIIILVALFAYVSSMAQNAKDTVQLETVNIQAKQQKQFYGLPSCEIDNTILDWNRTNDLGTLFSKNTGIFIKSYGRGSTASISMRGSTSSQVQVLWNGMNINSPSLGQVDFSLIPVYFTGNIAVVAGGSSLYESTGGIGGSINLQNKAVYRDELSIQFIQGYGSFNTYESFARISAGNSRINSVSGFLFTKSENNFKFINVDKPGHPEEVRKNAAYDGMAFQQELYYKVKPNQLLSAVFFIQDYVRRIPASTVQSNTDPKTRQTDFIIRSLLQWKLIREKYLLHIQGGYMKEENAYNDEDINLYSMNKTDSWFLNNNFTYGAGEKLIFNLKNKNSYQRGNSDNLGGIKYRWVSSLMLLTTYNPWEQLTLNLILKEEYQESFSPLMPSLSTTYDLFNNEDFQVEASVSKNYRYPTLNDLYWKYDGYAIGNKDLIPESSILSDAGFTGNLKILNLINFKYNLKAYYSNTNDMIYWSLVNENQQIWKPLNLHSVESKGIEAGFDMKSSFKDLLLFINPQYVYTSSINKETGGNDDGMQLIYIPLHSGSLFAGISWKGFRLNYLAAYTGKRYTVSDNSRYLPEYLIHDFGIEKKVSLKSMALAIEIKINNLTDKQYRAIVKQPMPGRNYMIILKIMFNKNLKNHEEN